MLPSNTHIGAWFMPEDIVDDICEYWDNPPEHIQKKQPGGVVTKKDGVESYGINRNIKDSTDLYISEGDYSPPWGQYHALLQACLESYMKSYPESGWTEKFLIKGRFNVQKYEKGGGYKTWHFENTGDESEVHRHLVFMTYLNDVPDGGTMFKYQNITVPAIKGLTLIFPAAFTHTHKSQVSSEFEKMIVTGWYSFERIYQRFESEYVNYVLEKEDE